MSSISKRSSIIEETGEQNKEAAIMSELKNDYRGQEPELDHDLEKRLEPLLDRVIVRRLVETETVKDGIIIPDGAQEKSTDAVVVCCGPGKVTETGELIPLKVKPGDRVILPHWGLTELEIKGTKYLILREEQIECIVRQGIEEEEV